MKIWARMLILLVVLCLACGCSEQAPQTTPGGAVTDGNTVTIEGQNPIASNVLLSETSAANTEILPRGISSGHTWVKELQGKTINVYYAASNDAFSYMKDKITVGESAWLTYLRKEYDINLHVVRKSPQTALSAQTLAMLSGTSLDLLSFTPGQLPFAMNMTADATTLMQNIGVTDTYFLNQSLLSYGDSGNRFFSPVGVARNLWYSKGEEKNSPLKLSENKEWDYEAFADYVRGRVESKDQKVTVYGYEAQSFTDFLLALETPMMSFDKKFTNTSEDAKITVQKLQELNAENGVFYSGKTTGNTKVNLQNGTLAMRYGQTPFVGTSKKYPAIEWAPLPTAVKGESAGKVTACAPVFALPKDGPQNKAALCAALLWTARYADANHDLLRITYGLDFTTWVKYYQATNYQMQICYTTDESLVQNLHLLVSNVAFSDEQYAEIDKLVNGVVVDSNTRLRQ